MAFYVPEADNFEDLTNEAIYPSLICKKSGPVPVDGTPDHQPSTAEDTFADMVGSTFLHYVVRREVLLADICEIDKSKLDNLLQKKHKSRPTQLAEITNRAKAKCAARIGRKRSDFLFFDEISGVVKGAIEVDGPYHLAHPQISFDYSKNLIFCGLGVVLLRLKDDEVIQAQALEATKRDAALKSMLKKARNNWETFKKHKTIANMQLHLTT